MWKVLVLFVYLSPGKSDASHRLPSNTVPQAYAINLAFGDFDDLSFTGSVVITINVSENTNIITLHTSMLVHNTSLTRLNYGGIEIAHTHDIDYENEFLIIRTTEETLQKFSIVLLRVDYSGVIGTNSDTEMGVFRRSYLNGDGSESYYIATRTKPSFARRIFPAYDEPSFKASFQISLSHSSRYRTLSNMREKSILDTNNGRRVSIFDSTSYLSPYLIAFIISEFDMIANTTTPNANNIALRIFAASSQQTQNAAFALETTRRALEIFESEFSYAFQYEIDKLDQVALPHFNPCSSVNYGLTFYRESCLLHDPLVNTAREKERAARAIINNVCHQLIDNKLTPSWWTDDSIAGGLCKFYEYHILTKMNPSSTTTIQGLFTVETMESALLSDTTAAAAETNNDDVAQWEQSDGVDYNKSASIFRMLLHSLSESTFTEGLKIYLSQSSLNPTGVTAQRDLYDAWQRAVSMREPDAMGNYKVSELFGSWEREGYPILHVERSYNDHRVRFTQRSIRPNDSSLWHIPITYSMRDSSQAGKFWLPQLRHFEMMIDDLKPNSHLLINVDRMGYYRVQYDEANWMLIARELSRPDASISSISRAMLINDAAVFLSNDILRARIFLELIKHLEHDVEYLPWLVATNNLQHIRWMVVDGSTKLSDDFKRFLQKLISKAFAKYGIEEQADGEENYHKNMRNIVIEWSCGVHLQSCLDVTREKISKFMLNEENERLSVDHEEVIFCHGLIMATEAEFDSIWRRFNATRQLFFLRGLGCIEDDRILLKFIRMIIECDDINPDEIMTILKATYSHNHVGLRVAIKFLRTHYDALIGLINKHNIMPSMNEIFFDIASKVNDEGSLATLSDILVIYNINSTIQDEVHTVIRENLKWLKQHTSDIEDFLDDFHSSSSLSATLSMSLLLIIVPLAIF